MTSGRGVFTVHERERVRDRVLALASSDARVVAGAVVGSLARDDGDRWSDLDLTFAVSDGTSVHSVLDDRTRILVREFDAVRLFDLPAGATIYRVFLLPGCLQVDLSFTPASDFGARGPTFRLLFGTAVEKPHSQPPSAQELFGYAVHHALRARFCVERGRYWQAEYWVSSVRDYALTLACRRRGLPARHGRGFDDLPADIRDTFIGALARSLDRSELLRALGSAITGLLREADAVQELAAKVEPELRKLTAEWEGGRREEVTMKPRVTVITIGVDDLERSLRFYRDGLGLPTKGIVGGEFEYGAVVFIDLQPGLRLALWPRKSIAHDTGLPPSAKSPTNFTLGHNVSSRAEVDAVMVAARNAGAAIVKPAQEAFWGGYAGYFQDPDGHLWEVAWNPQWTS